MTACGPTSTPTRIADARRECLLLTVGAQDTTSAFTSSLFNFILFHASTHADVRAEICQATLSPVLRYDETCQLALFMARVQETLRLSPPIYLFLPRYAAAEGMLLNRIPVRKEADVAANPYLVHRI